jgi:hypothetical protein
MVGAWPFGSRGGAAGLPSARGREALAIGMQPDDFAAERDGLCEQFGVGGQRKPQAGPDQIFFEARRERGMQSLGKALFPRIRAQAMRTQTPAQADLRVRADVTFRDVHGKKPVAL